MTQRSKSKLRTMSEPVPLLHPTLDPLTSCGWIGLLIDTSLPCDSDQQIGRQNVDVVPETAVVSEQSSEEAKKLTHCGALACQREAKVVSGSNLLPSHVNLSEDCSTDLRIVKHKPSAIVFFDRDPTSECQEGLKESSDSGGSSLPSTEDGERQDDNDEDDFLQASQHKEFLVSRRRRVLSRNRKSLRKRLDALPKSTVASGWRKSANEAKPEVAGGLEERETGRRNGKQVRPNTRQE